MKKILLAGMIISLWLVGCNAVTPVSSVEQAEVVSQEGQAQPQDVPITVYKAPT